MTDYAVPDIRRKEPFFLRPLMYIAVGGLAAWGAVVGWQTWNDTSAATHEKAMMPGLYGLGAGTHKTLDPKFTSSNGLTASLPSDPSRLIDPPTLGIAYDESDQDGAIKIPWD